MAQVRWQKRAERELYKCMVKGYMEFGETTANKFADKVAAINKDLERFPEAGFPEPLLHDRERLYRARYIIGPFKIIYYYNATADTVHVADIWDARRNPQSLSNRPKK